MKKIFIIAFILLTSTMIMAQDKSTVFAKIKKQYGNANTVLIIFNSVENSKNNYTLKAKKGNKFNIAFTDRKIICDGKYVWNYNINAKNVVISEYVEELTGMSLDHFFFNIFDKSAPVNLKTELSSSSKKSYILDLDCSVNSIDIKNVSLYLDSSYSKIKGIKISYSDGEIKWYIKHIEINKTMKDDEFSFKIPTGIEVIDYR